MLNHVAELASARCSAVARQEKGEPDSNLSGQRRRNALRRCPAPSRRDIARSINNKKVNRCVSAVARRRITVGYGEGNMRTEERAHSTGGVPRLVLAASPTSSLLLTLACLHCPGASKVTPTRCVCLRRLLARLIRVGALFTTYLSARLVLFPAGALRPVPVPARHALRGDPLAGPT